MGCGVGKRDGNVPVVHSRPVVTEEIGAVCNLSAQAELILLLL